LQRIDSEHFEAASAAIDRGEMHPLTIEVMNEIGINLEHKVPTSLNDLKNKNFDFVITLSEHAKNHCPIFPGSEQVHWLVEDPMVPSDPVKQQRAFRTVRDQIAQRLNLFVLVQVRKTPSLTTTIRPDRPAQPTLV